VKFFPKDQLKLGFQYYNNNSSERYLHYYDYDSYKGTASLTHLFNNKTFGYFSFSRERGDYHNRSISTNNGRCQDDRTYVLTSALYYNIKKDFTLGLSYTYRNNYSNEPMERYQSSMFTVGTYYKF
ncbi:MAG: hypothetical protein JW788_05120, partial [Candidatus Omnitrophica bacterium]|nr:hypothetical protein [Candidatus Omnitrophota bacterium]